MASSQADLPCPAWVWSNNSNFHVAKDRSWFGEDYIPITSELSGGVQVIGIGTVELPTDTGSHGILRLEKVLHVPHIICNIIGAPITNDHGVSMSSSETSSGSIVRRPDNRIMAYLEPMTEAVPLLQVRLSKPPIGPQVGPLPFDPSSHYLIRAHWPDSERVKHCTFQLNAAERAWMKKHYGNEFRFLQSYGLSIYKNEGREEGRSIARAMMAENEK